MKPIPSHVIIANSDIRGQLSTDGGQTFGFAYTGQPYNSLFRVAVGSTETRSTLPRSTAHGSCRH